MLHKKCPNPRQAFNDDFIVINSYGIHEVLLNFCNCAEAKSYIQQLLHMFWFPSTTANPKTAATFCILDKFHLLSFKSKVSAYKFYSALMRGTDNTGLMPVKVCNWLLGTYVDLFDSSEPIQSFYKDDPWMAASHDAQTR